MMPGWTPDHSMILSMLLDAVVGTQKMIEIRQDYCKIYDSLMSTIVHQNSYFTGSKSEGLDLPGSDEDYMADMNELICIKVTQSLDDSPGLFPYTTFFMSTENTPPGFALLQLVHQTMMTPLLYRSLQYMYGTQYLSSDLYMQNTILDFRNIIQNYVPIEQAVINRQGPSAEVWTPFCDKSESGIDNVDSIHCAFWPTEVLEWVQRPRHFGWPSSQDISSIINFGFHLVPIGHPLSDTKLMEWRISFSVAEQILVWSFTHVQIQCYAVMKIILKEFIKVKCNPQNQVLCSYFIKTFLFWKYESTELNFWRADNFRECIMYLLTEFSKCVREGVLRHYFIPRFNLLSIKLTLTAHTELLQLFDIIIQSDITIFKECRTLQDIWSEILAQVHESRNNLIYKLKRENLQKSDECMARMVGCLSLNISLGQSKIFQTIRKICNVSFNNEIREILALSCKTHLKTITLRHCIYEMNRRSLCDLHIHNPGNKGIYQLCRTAKNDIYSYDISRCKLWCAILLYMKGFTMPALDIVNQFLSSIPPYVMYYSQGNCVSNEAKQLYVDMFLDSDATIIQRAKSAWMFDFVVTQDMTDFVPLAIQIELYFLSLVPLIALSPFTCAYYLQFMCYHQTQQYQNRDRALQQLVEVAYNRDQSGNFPWHSFNIAGHCLLLAGRTAQAQDMFNLSYEIAQMRPPFDRYTSALWYLHNFF